MPEGHTIHRLARRHRAVLGGRRVAASSPQGRFAEGAALLDGLVLARTEAAGKHLFHHYASDAEGGGEHRLLHVHLGLYGKFTEGEGEPPEPRGALRLRLVADGHWLDLRGAIACELLDPPEQRAILERLGPDPLRRAARPDRALSRIGRSRSPIGTLLMDQTVLAGVGNVYRAEALYRQGLDPFTPGRDVDPEVAVALWADLVTLMRAGVRSGRIVTTHPEDRERPSGRARATDAHYVYRRAGLPCRRCGTTVLGDVLANRNLFWCPTCQRAPA